MPVARKHPEWRRYPVDGYDPVPEQRKEPHCYTLVIEWTLPWTHATCDPARPWTYIFFVFIPSPLTKTQPPRPRYLGVREV